MNESELYGILAAHKKVAIVGGPQTGKTTLAKKVTDRKIFHNDEAKWVPWENQPGYWMEKTAGHDSFVIEGVHAARALRKGLKVDAVIHMQEPKAEQSAGQQSMHKGQQKIISEALASQPEAKVYYA